MKHLKGQQFLFTKTSNESEVSQKILSHEENFADLSLSFNPASPCLLFFRMNRGKNIAQTFLCPIDRITKYSSERFLSSRGQKMSKHFLSSVLLQWSDHCLKSYKSALIYSMNNARLMKPEKNKQTSNAT